MRIEAAIDRAASVVPDKVALRCGGRAWTYAELRAERDRRAGMLVEAGLAVGDRLITAERMSDDYVITHLACAQAGVIFVGLSPLLTPAERATLAARVAPQLACTGDGSPDPSLPASRTLPLALPGTPTDGARHEAARRSATGSPDDPCEIRPTSGTTNERPKLVVRPHRTYTWRCSREAWTVAERRVSCSMTPNQFEGAGTCSTFAVGGTVVIPVTVGIYGLEEELAAQGVLTASTTPALLTALVRQEAPSPTNLRLRLLQTSGASLPHEVRHAAMLRYRTTIVQRYGMAECIGLMASPPEAPIGSTGKPNPGVEARLLADNGDEVPAGAVGELVVRSPGLMLGYWDDQAATDEVLRGGSLHTGDGARRDAEGNYYLVGRRGLQINVGGMKVAPEEVEAVLIQHPGVREAVVLPQPDALRGETVRAIIVPEDEAPEAQALRRFCRERLAGYKVPRVIVFRAEPLPRSALGKVLRQQV